MSVEISLSGLIEHSITVCVEVLYVIKNADISGHPKRYGVYCDLRKVMWAHDVAGTEKLDRLYRSIKVRGSRQTIEVVYYSVFSDRAEFAARTCLIRELRLITTTFFVNGELVCDYSIPLTQEECDKITEFKLYLSNNDLNVTIDPSP